MQLFAHQACPAELFLGLLIPPREQTTTGSMNAALHRPDTQAQHRRAFVLRQIFDAAKPERQAQSFGEKIHAAGEPGEIRTQRGGFVG